LIMETSRCRQRAVSVLNEIHRLVRGRDAGGFTGFHPGRPPRRGTSTRCGPMRREVSGVEPG
jgi:hypothetical protein